MVPEDILAVLGLKEGDLIELHFDLFSLPALDFSRIKRILFDYKSLDTDISQGAYLLKYLDIDPSLEFDPQNYFDERFLQESIEKGRLINTDLGKVALGVLYKAREMLTN